MQCSRPSFLRKQESRPPARWMPDHVRHDEISPCTARAYRETPQYAREADSPAADIR